MCVLFRQTFAVTYSTEPDETQRERDHESAGTVSLHSAASVRRGSSNNIRPGSMSGTSPDSGRDARGFAA
jgi:hypothetical protein